jgi:hypothetical protein
VRLEDLYDVPQSVTVELVGGWYDGRRITVPENQGPWVVLPAPPMEPSIMPVDFSKKPPTMPQPLSYRWTGSIRDDGTRVFRYEG